MRVILSLFLLALLLPAVSYAQDFKPVTVADKLAHPWAVAFLPDGEFLVTERDGRLLRLSADGKTRTEIQHNLKVVARRQAGLLDIALHPDFRNNGLVYLAYIARGYGGTGLEVVRARLVKDRLAEIEPIFVAQPKLRTDLNLGSRLLFDRDGFLYISVGDRFQQDKAQDLSNHIGKIIRVRDDGQVPADNPFVGRDGALPEIYSYGNRNVQGMTLAPDGKAIWMHEHGPQGGDEVNILKAGANYGWPLVTYGIDYDGKVISGKTEAPGIEPPLLHWTPSIAPSGLAFYKGDLYAGALAGAHLRRLTVRDGKITDQTVLLADLEERIRDVRTGPDGQLYILTDMPEGRLIRLEKTAE